MKSTFFLFVTLFLLATVGQNANAQSTTSTVKFDKDTTGKEQFDAQLTIAPGAVADTFTVNFTLGSPARTYEGAGKNSTSGIKQTTLTNAVFAIPGVTKVELLKSALIVTKGTGYDKDKVTEALVKFAASAPLIGRGAWVNNLPGPASH